MANEDRTSEFFRDEAGQPSARALLRDRVHWLVDHATGRVLDVGCSQGITAMLCARAGHDVVGIDNEADRIGYALADRESKPPGVRDRLEFRVGDASALELPDSSFDTVLLGEVIEHLDDPGPVLAEVARVAAPDGRVLVTVPFGYSPHPDHSRSFYVSSFLDVLAPHLAVASVEVADGYIRAIARPEPMSQGALDALKLESQPALEAALIAEAHRATRDRRRIRRRTRRDKRQLRRHLRNAERRERDLARRLDSFRRSRWTRLGRALARARTPRGLIALPLEAARAMRRKPAAKPPRRPRREVKKEPRERALLVTADATSGTDARLRVELPDAEPLPAGPVARPDLRVATILDPFSATAFRYEWDQIEPGPGDWRQVLELDPPDLLFVESAWRGNGDRWARALVGSGPFARDLAELVGWCRERGVPTVFWNKEDPPRFSTFLPAARLFDYVFTTDSNRVGSYQEATGNEDVSVLMFGAQPRVHNPIAPIGARHHPVAFAGTYFAHKHPHRRAQMEAILDPARDFDLQIFARVPPGERDHFEWPEKYVPHIVGSLPYERMVHAVKAYRLFLNVNSVVASPTMCARRAFEISATATPLLSGDSVALRNVFGERASIARDAPEAREHLELLLGDTELAARRGHEAMRHVMRGHTYGHRVDQVLRTVGLDAHAGAGPLSVSAVIAAEAGDPPPVFARGMAAQTQPPMELVVTPVGAGADADSLAAAARSAGIGSVTVTAPAADQVGARVAGAAAARGDLIALMAPENHYAEHFLEDLVAAFSYADAAVVGKPLASGAEHAYSFELEPGTLLARAETAREIGFGPAAGSPQQGLLEACRARGLRAYAADRYSFHAAHAGPRGEAAGLAQ